MWKKLLTPTLIITLVALFALTWYCSIKAEEYFSLWVERSNQYLPANTTNKLVSYERGFFTAEAITTVDITALDRYDFHHLIRHYAWGVTMITTAVVQPDSPSLLDGLRIITDIGPTGAARSRLSLPQLTVKTAFGPTVTIDRIAGEGRVSAAATEGSWNFNLEEIHVGTNDDRRFIIAGINSSAEMENLDHFPLGQSRTRINSLTLETADTRPFVINGLNIVGSNFLDNAQRYVTRSDLSFERVLAGDNTLLEGRLILELNELDTRVIEAVMAARNRLRHHINSPSSIEDALTKEVILPIYHALLESGATLALENLSLATPGGQLSGAGRAALKPGKADTSFVELLEQIVSELQLDFDVVILAHLNQLAEKMQGKSSNIARKEEELRMIFGGLAQLGFLTRMEGDRFRLRIAYDEGEIKLNNQPFRLF